MLSGGGVRGFAHLGFLKLLDEIGLKPYAISGVSAGAIAGTVESRLQQCTFYLEPDLHRFNMFDVKKADEIFEIGYTTASRQRARLEKLILTNE